MNISFILKGGSRTRGFQAALVKETCRLDTRKNSHTTHRVINEWNKLSNDCVNASCLDIFKQIDIYLIRAGYT